MKRPDSRNVLTSETSPLRLDRIVPENEACGWVALTIAPGKRTSGERSPTGTAISPLICKRFWPQE